MVCSTLDEAFLRKIERVVLEFDSCALECDGMTSVLSTLLNALNIQHTRFSGGVRELGTSRIVRPHLWIELAHGWVIDLRLRMWLGDCSCIPHGVFKPAQFGMDYQGEPILRPLPPAAVVDLLCDLRMEDVINKYAHLPG